MLLAATDSTLALLDPATGELLRPPVTVERPLIARFDVSPDGTRVVLAVDHNHGGDHRDEGSARVIDLATAAEISRAKPAQQDDRPVAAAVFSGDGKFVLCGREDTTLLTIAATGAERWRIDMGAHEMAADPTGKWLVIALAEGMAQAYDTDMDKKAQTLHDGAVTHVAVSANGRWFASAGNDSVVRVHNIETDADRFHRDDLGEVKAMAFSQDSRFLALAIDQGVVLLNNASSS
jgi:WD40 repeat protein